MLDGTTSQLPRPGGSTNLKRGKSTTGLRLFLSTHNQSNTQNILIPTTENNNNVSKISPFKRLRHSRSSNALSTTTSSSFKSIIKVDELDYNDNRKDNVACSSSSSTLLSPSRLDSPVPPLPSPMRHKPSTKSVKFELNKVSSFSKTRQRTKSHGAISVVAEFSQSCEFLNLNSLETDLHSDHGKNSSSERKDFEEVSKRDDLSEERWTVQVQDSDSNRQLDRSLSFTITDSGNGGLQRQRTIKFSVAGGPSNSHGDDQTKTNHTWSSQDVISKKRRVSMCEDKLPIAIQRRSVIDHLKSSSSSTGLKDVETKTRIRQRSNSSPPSFKVFSMSSKKPPRPPPFRRALTSPISSDSSNVKKSIEFSVYRLLSREVFMALLSDHAGRCRFRRFLQAKDMRDERKLDVWWDLGSLENMMKGTKDVIEAIQETHLKRQGFLLNEESFPTELLSKSLLQVFESHNQHFESPRKQIFENMYKEDFLDFVKWKISQVTLSKLGETSRDFSKFQPQGLGDSFCLTNPRHKDNPIVLISQGFTSLTGYTKEQIIGRNCRILQGPGTDPESKKRIRNAFIKGETCTELLLNYRKDGKPFFNLLTIIPLRDSSSNLTYCIGGQINVTEICSSAKNIALLIGGPDSTPEDLPRFASSSSFRSLEVRELIDIFDFSPSLKSHKNEVYVDCLDPSPLSPSTIRTSDVGSSSPGFNGTNIGTLRNNGSTRLFGKLFGKVTGKNLEFQPSSKIVTSERQFPEICLSNRMMCKDLGPLEMKRFFATFSKLFILRSDSREILFLTLDILIYFGLPIDNPDDSPLLHTDICTYLIGNDKSDTKRIRTAVKTCIKREENLSIECTANFTSRKLSKSHFAPKLTKLHLTPLLDSNGKCSSYVALFA